MALGIVDISSCFKPSFRTAHRATARRCCGLHGATAHNSVAAQVTHQMSAAKGSSMPTAPSSASGGWNAGVDEILVEACASLVIL